MPVVEPVVNEEKLRQLLAEQGESEQLDYKTMCDLSQTQDLVELAKDVGAMQIDGGFVVVGADERGRATGEFKIEAARLFDEATLRAKLLKYLEAPLDLRCATHELGTDVFAILAIGPSTDGFAIFGRDGIYEVSQASGKPKTEITFRKGDVFARHGSASEKWQQADIRRVTAKIVAREKESWRREFADTVGLKVGDAAQRIAQAPANALSWELDEETFIATVVEQLRGRDEIPLKLLMARAPEDAHRLAIEPNRIDEVGTLIDRLTCVAALALHLDDQSLFERTLASLGEVYDVGYQIEAETKPGAAANAARYWLTVIERVYALGALAVRERRWDAVRVLALRRPLPLRGDAWHPTWLRHSLTTAARTGLFKATQDGRAVELSLLSLAKKHADREVCLRRGLRPQDERIMDSLCQFDALASLAAMSATRSLDGRVFYTSFARFFSERTEPVLVRLVQQPEMRSVIFPSSDQELATALVRLDQVAKSEGFSYAGWEGFSDLVLRDFIKEHYPRPPQGS